jgi:hypothetical protein
LLGISILTLGIQTGALQGVVQLPGLLQPLLGATKP